MDHIHSNDIPTFPQQTFFHPGITFDPKNYKIHFSSEAKDEIQKIINWIQSQLKIDEAKNEEIGIGLESDTKNIPITPQVIDHVVDGMFADWKWKKSIKKFIERVVDILGKKKKWQKAAETIEKIEKKVQKYSNQNRIEIIIGYSDGNKNILLQETPITVWIWQDLPTMLNSLNTRLWYTQVISKAKKSSH